MAKLSDKQQRFCEEYIVDLNGTQAAIRAEYGKKGAATTSSRMLLNVAIKAEITRLRTLQTKRTGISADMVIKDLALMARLGSRKEGDVPNPVEAKALELLGKHFKLFTEIHEVTAKQDLIEVLAAIGRGG